MRLPTPPNADPQPVAGFEEDELDQPSSRRVSAARLRDLEAIERNARRVSQQAKEAGERAQAATAQALFLVGERTRMACLIGMMAQRLGHQAFVAPLPSGQEGYRTMIGARLPNGLVWWAILDSDAGIPRACGLPDAPTPQGAERLPAEQMYQVVLAPGLSGARAAAPEPEPDEWTFDQKAPQAADVDLSALPAWDGEPEPEPEPEPDTPPQPAPTCDALGTFHAPRADGSGCQCGFFGGPTPSRHPATPATPATTPRTETTRPLPMTGPQPDGIGTWGFRCASCDHQEVGIKGRKAARARYQAHRADAHP